MHELTNCEIFDYETVYVDYEYEPEVRATETDPPLQSAIEITKVVDRDDNDMLEGLTIEDLIELEDIVIEEHEKEMEQANEGYSDDWKYEKDDWGIR